MKADGLWGEHLRWNLRKTGVDEGWPAAGQSCVSFRLPDSKKVTIVVGSVLDTSKVDIKNTRHDALYGVRIVRVTARSALG